MAGAPNYVTQILASPWFVTDGPSIQSHFARIAGLLTEKMPADACLLYVKASEGSALTRSATSPAELTPGDETLAWLSARLMEMTVPEVRSLNMCSNDLATSGAPIVGPHSKPDRAALLAPVMSGEVVLGILGCWRKSNRMFARDDEVALSAAALHIGIVLENARLYRDSVPAVIAPVSIEPTGAFRWIPGKAGAEGTAVGPACMLDRHATLISLAAKDRRRRKGLARLRQAVELSESQLRGLADASHAHFADVTTSVFEGHIAILKDKSFAGDMERLVRSGQRPTQALLAIATEHIARLGASPSAFARERAADVEDVSLRLMANLVSEVDISSQIAVKSVVVSSDMLPSEIVAYAGQGVSGVILLEGGVTAHVAILARSLGIPLVIVDDPGLLSIPPGTRVVVDADNERVGVNPPDEVVAVVEERARARVQEQRPRDPGPIATITKDGTRIALMANVNLLIDGELACTVGAEGVGLYRTEFIFMTRASFPSEDEQALLYRMLVERMAGRPITFRTLDVGGDKLLSYAHTDSSERNPTMGLRAIRFSLTHTNIMRAQIRAMLRAGAGADIGIMFPMVNSLDEFRDAKRITIECVGELSEAGIECNATPRIGMMVEVPSTVELASEFAAEADFLSIGTNDFTQYTLAVDRTNASVASLYQPHHPSVLRGIKRLVEGATKQGTPISVCGDIARDAEYLPFLIGIGISSLSIHPASLAKARAAIEMLSIHDARKLAKRVLECSTSGETAKALGLNQRGRE